MASIRLGRFFLKEVMASFVQTIPDCNQSTDNGDGIQYAHDTARLPLRVGSVNYIATLIRVITYFTDHAVKGS